MKFWGGVQIGKCEALTAILNSGDPSAAAFKHVAFSFKFLDFRL